MVEGVDGAEAKPTGPLTQYQDEQIISNIANLTLGGEAAAKTHEAAAKAHVATRQQQRRNEAKLENTVADPSSKEDSSREVTKVIKNDKRQAGKRVSKGLFRGSTK